MPWKFRDAISNAQCTPPTPTRQNSFVASAVCIGHNDSRVILLTDRQINTQTDTTGNSSTLATLRWAGERWYHQCSRGKNRSTRCLCTRDTKSPLSWYIQPPFDLGYVGSTCWAEPPRQGSLSPLHNTQHMWGKYVSKKAVLSQRCPNDVNFVHNVHV